MKLCSYVKDIDNVEGYTANIKEDEVEVE